MFMPIINRIESVPSYHSVYFTLLLCFSLPILANDDSAISAGKDSFQRNCGICHGIDGRGSGAFAELLKVSPPDLTVLSRKNHGTFPFSDVYNSIDGRNTLRAHGERNMPIWGDRFKSSVRAGDETLIRGRIMELILYIKSIQQF